jgi:hypothetical protein
VKTRKPVVVSKSVLAAISLCQEMVRLVFGNHDQLGEATVKFKDETDLKWNLNRRWFDQVVELWHVEVIFRMASASDDELIATFHLAKMDSGKLERVAEKELKLRCGLRYSTKREHSFGFDDHLMVKKIS